MVEVHHAALPIGFREDLCGCFRKPTAGIRDDQPHTLSMCSAPSAAGASSPMVASQVWWLVVSQPPFNPIEATASRCAKTTLRHLMWRPAPRATGKITRGKQDLKDCPASDA